MSVVITCKFVEDPIKTEGATDRTRSQIAFFWHLMPSNSKMNNPFWPELKVLRDIMHVLVTCKFNEDPIKTEGDINRTTFASNMFSSLKGK